MEQPTTERRAAPMLGRVVLLVRDYDEALAFYAAAFGAEPLHDSNGDDERYLHVGFPRQPAAEAAVAPVGLWLLRARAAEERALVGRQAGRQPFLVLYTNDCREAVDRVARAGGGVRREVRTEAETTFAHVLDLYGNEIVLVELGAPAA